MHVGPYDRLRETYERIDAWITEQGLQPRNEVWERYDAGPGTNPDPATWRTRIIWPVSGAQAEHG